MCGGVFITLMLFNILFIVVFKSLSANHMISSIYETTPFFFFLFIAAPVAYGSSRARGQIGASAAGLQHSHSARPGIEPASSWILQLVLNLEPQQEV